jgi:large subunit ribosomal protein L4
MKLNLYNAQGQVAGEVELNDAIFGAEVKPHLHWMVVRWQMAKKRAGTHSVKTRATVSRVKQKAYRQKGTGNARHGSYGAPIFVGGGKVFGPSPRKYVHGVNKKVRAGALRSALSEMVRDEKIKVIDGFGMDTIKTKRAAAVLTALEAHPKSLVVDGDRDETLDKSMRNLAKAKYLPAAGLNVYDILNCETLVITKAGLEAVEGRLS